MDWVLLLTKESIFLFGYAILAGFVFANTKMDATDKRIFYGAIVTALIENFLYEMERWTALLAEPTLLRTLFSMLGYSLRPYLLYLMIQLTDHRLRTKEFRRILGTPVVIVALITGLSLFGSHLVFWYNPRNNFMRGPLGYLPHIVCSIYTALFIVESALAARNYKNRIDVVLSGAISIFAGFSMVTGLLDVLTNYMRVCIMLTMLFLYVQHQNRALSAMVDEIPGAVAYYRYSNGKVKLISFNDTMHKMLHISRTEYERATRDSAYAFLSGEAKEAADKTIAALQSGANESELVFRRMIGSEEHWFRMMLRVTNRNRGEIHAYSIMTDITKEKQVEDSLRIREEELSLSMMQMGKTVCVFDVKNKLLTMPESYAKNHGFPQSVAKIPDDLYTEDFLHRNAVDPYLKFYDRMLSGDANGSLLDKFVRKDGSVVWERADFVTIYDAKGKPARAIVTIEDATAAYEEREALLRYRDTINSLVGDNRFYLQYDILQERIVAYEGGLFPGIRSAVDKPLWEIVDYIAENYVKKDERASLWEFTSPMNLQEICRSGEKSCIQCIFALDNGLEHWVRLTAEPNTVNGRSHIITLVWQDVDDEYRNQQSLLNRANYDELTKLLTRSATMQEIENYLLGDGRQGRHALIMMDLDNLKQVNDKLGHQWGDAAIRHFAQQVKQAFRTEDIVGRVGGDEFFAFLKNISPETVARKLGELLKDLEIVYTDNGVQVETSASAGVAIYRGDVGPVKTLHQLYSEADVALYKSKSGGKRSFTFADSLDAANAVESANGAGDAKVTLSLRTMFNRVGAGVVIYHGDSLMTLQPVFCNDSFLQIIEMSFEEFLRNVSRNPVDCIHPDDKGRIGSGLREAIRSGNRLRANFRLVTGKGDYRWVSTFITVYRSEDGCYDIYGIYADAQEEMTDRIDREHHFSLFTNQERTLQFDRTAIIRFNLTKDTCLNFYDTANLRETLDTSSATAFQNAVSKHIPSPMLRHTFLKTFLPETLLKAYDEGRYTFKMNAPYTFEKGTIWCKLFIEMTKNPESGDIEAIGSILEADREVRMQIVFERLMHTGYELIGTLDVSTQLFTVIGGKVATNDAYVYQRPYAYMEQVYRSLPHLVDESELERGYTLLSLASIVAELEKQDFYMVTLPSKADQTGRRSTYHWHCCYLSADKREIIILRNNVIYPVGKRWKPVTDKMQNLPMGHRRAHGSSENA